jgi:general secretion pathway protein G
MKPRASRLTPHASRPFGFTLIELLVVLAIIATLLTLVVPRYYQHVERSREAVLRENLASVRDAIDQYHADAGAWPDTLQTLVDRRYLRSLPADPITEKTDTWLLVPPPDGGNGVYDIHSGAEGTGLDGLPYRDW